MDLYLSKSWWKILLMIAGFAIIAASLYYNNQLAKNLADEEQKKMEIYAGALSDIGKSAPKFSTPKDAQAFERWHDTSLELAISSNNTTIPVIVTTSDHKIILHNNLDKSKIERQKELGDSTYLKNELANMMSYHEPLELSISEDVKQLVWYRESYLLRQLRWYPYIQLMSIFAFLSFGYWAFSSARKAEQNKVWLGMAKETAHQLGTPLTSLLGWVELLKISEDPSGTMAMIGEGVEKDIKRLNLISDRFSKIGSEPKLEEMDLAGIVKDNFDYIAKIAPKKVTMNYEHEGPSPAMVKVSPTLFGWVIENLLKNALDAMDGKGNINLLLRNLNDQIIIDVSDTGKGMPKSRFKTVFEPGFSTKKRGWGLGLSLSKRIVEYFHKGQIFVHQSSVGKGTTFRIIFDKNIASGEVNKKQQQIA